MPTPLPTIQEIIQYHKSQVLLNDRFSKAAGEAAEESYATRSQWHQKAVEALEALPGAENVPEVPTPDA